MNQHKKASEEDYKRWAKESYAEHALQNVTEFPGGAVPLNIPDFILSGIPS